MSTVLAGPEGGRVHSSVPFAEAWLSSLQRNREQAAIGAPVLTRFLTLHPSQMLLNICSESQGLEGLLSGSELQSLLIATTCLREHSCYFWKEPTFCVLRAISKAQSPSVIQYLRSRFPETRCGLWVTQGVPATQSKAPAPPGSFCIGGDFWKEEPNGQLTQYMTPLYMAPFGKICASLLLMLHWRRRKGGIVYTYVRPHREHAGPACSLHR